MINHWAGRVISMFRFVNDIAVLTESKEAVEWNIVLMKQKLNKLVWPWTEENLKYSHNLEIDTRNKNGNRKLVSKSGKNLEILTNIKKVKLRQAKIRFKEKEDLSCKP